MLSIHHPQKGPRSYEQPGPHGHPDVALPSGKIQKKPSLSTSLGLAKGYGYASFSWEMQVAKSGGWCQEVRNAESA